MLPCHVDVDDSSPPFEGTLLRLFSGCIFQNKKVQNKKGGEGGHSRVRVKVRVRVRVRVTLFVSSYQIILVTPV